VVDIENRAVAMILVVG